MIGIAIEILISWLLLKYIEHQNLYALGIKPTRQRIKDLLLGLVLPMVYLSALLLGIAWLVKNPYKLNPAYSISNFWVATCYTFKAVVYEELLFRGAILYILIKKIGDSKALLISAVSFGIYHWFTFGILGQPLQMAIVFLMTGVVGFLFALAFKKTGSMYLPFALHLGFDFCSMVIFSNDKHIGSQLLIKTFINDPATPGAIIAIPILIVYYIGFPLLCYSFVRFSINSKHQISKGI